MREIEFRGKDSTGIMNHDWFYGSLDTSFNEDFPRIICKDKWGNTMLITVDGETVGQYTGQKDKFEKKIFEGDILSSLYKDDGCMGVYVITFDNGAFYPKRYGKHQQIYVRVSMTDLKWCEVIGNIHDNPELLTHQHEDKGE